MGQIQVKCECGLFSKVKINVKNASADFNYIENVTGYLAWSYRYDEFECTACKDCARLIMKNLRMRDIHFDEKTNEKGWFRTDLP